MVLCQFIITPSNNNTRHFVGINGKVNVKVISVQYSGNKAVTDPKVIQLRSDLLYFQHSPAKYLTFMANAQGSVNFDQSGNPNIPDLLLYNDILLHVVDTATNVQPVDFSNCILTLEIKQSKDQ